MESIKVNTMKESTYKIPNGKLLKIKLWVEHGKIKRVMILGDFFLHPENTIVELEDHLAGKPLDEEILSSDIDSFLSESKATLIGADGSSIAKAILIASNLSES
ncbi:MAG: hypothetical protein GF411_15835 [Candidatus Lokiarchaeota archaeon]|nr:hypothetical protein [Candidatus Lokiarchaeota archaeon]